MSKYIRILIIISLGWINSQLLSAISTLQKILSAPAYKLASKIEFFREKAPFPGYKSNEHNNYCWTKLVKKLEDNSERYILGLKGELTRRACNEFKDGLVIFYLKKDNRVVAFQDNISLRDEGWSRGGPFAFKIPHDHGNNIVAAYNIIGSNHNILAKEIRDSEGKKSLYLTLSGSNDKILDENGNIGPKFTKEYKEKVWRYARTAHYKNGEEIIVFEPNSKAKIAGGLFWLGLISATLYLYKKLKSKKLWLLNRKRKPKRRRACSNITY